jgi:histidinol dehydrogenase
LINILSIVTNTQKKKQITMWTQTTTNDQIKEDSIVEAIRTQLKDRSDVGIRKYNTTLDRTDLSLLDWLEHAKQEALDFALYLERIKREVKEKGLDG